MLILASQSESRKAMLDAAGIHFEARGSDVDETLIKRELIAVPPGEVAMILAEAKAMAVSVGAPDRLVLGGDSVIEVGGRLFDKARDRDEAAEHLQFFSGQEMRLYAAAALMRDGRTVWRHVDCARLRVRTLGLAFIERYLEHEWPAVAGCVGVFRIEGQGVHLFQHVEGSHFSVLGMPLLPLLHALREQGEIEA